MNKTKRTMSASAQKLKGKAQQALGEYQMAMGQNVKGGISKAKGVLNEKIADAKLNINANRTNNKRAENPDYDDNDLI